MTVLRFIAPVFIGRHHLYDQDGHGQGAEERHSRSIPGVLRDLQDDGALVLYCEHLQTVKYRNPLRQRCDRYAAMAGYPSAFALPGTATLRLDGRAGRLSSIRFIYRAT